MSASEVSRERLEVMVVPGVPQAVGSVRRCVRDLLGPDHPALDGVLVCLSEVVTNAIRHTASGRNGEIRIEATLSASEVRIGTLDQGGTTTEPRLATPEDDGENGRGLTLLNALADDWGAEQQGDGTLVWFTVKC